MKEWKTEELGGLVKAGGGRIQTGPFGSQLHAADYVDEGIPCIMPTNMENNRVRLDGIARIAEGDAQRLKRHIVKTGDIVYSRRGDVTQKALIHPTEDGYFCGTGCLLLRPGDKIDPTFLTYYLSTKTYQNWIVSQAVGGTMPNLNTGILERVSFTAPDKDTQKKIAKVLATLDAKIALNNRINAELEAMAKLLYDYWFVQFDFPMTAAQAAALGQAQLEGQPYKSSGGKMVFDPTLKREIPEGWEARSISSLTAISKENTSPAKTPNKEFKLFSIPIFDQTKTYSIDCGASIGSDKFVVSKADLLVSKLNPWFSRVVYAEDEKDMVCSTEFVVWRTRNEWSKNILYMVATDPRFIGHCVQSASGTSNSHKRVSPDVMISHAIPYDEGTLKSFALKIGPMIKAKLANQKQNQELTTLRDWLLPILMNGQVTVKG